MEKGIIQSLILYSAGFGLAEIIYLIYGHPYIHAPGLHHLIILLTLAIGLAWTLYSLNKIVFKNGNPKYSGIIISNCLVFIGMFLYIFFS